MNFIGREIESESSCVIVACSFVGNKTGLIVRGGEVANWEEELEEWNEFHLIAEFLYLIGQMLMSYKERGRRVLIVV